MPQSTSNRRRALNVDRTQPAAAALLDRGDDKTEEARAGTSSRLEAPAPVAPAKEATHALTVKVPVSLHERMRRASFERREPLKDITTRALLGELERLGF